MLVHPQLHRPLTHLAGQTLARMWWTLATGLTLIGIAPCMGNVFHRNTIVPKNSKVFFLGMEINVTNCCLVAGCTMGWQLAHPDLWPVSFEMHSTSRGNRTVSTEDCHIYVFSFPCTGFRQLFQHHHWRPSKAPETWRYVVGFRVTYLGHSRFNLWSVDFLPRILGDWLFVETLLIQNDWSLVQHL